MKIVALVCILAGMAVVDSSVLPGARKDTLGHAHGTDETSGHVHGADDTSGHVHSTEDTSGQLHGSEKTVEHVNTAEDVSGHVEDVKEPSNPEPSEAEIPQRSGTRVATLKEETGDANTETDLQKDANVLNIEEESEDVVPKIDSFGDLSSARTEERDRVIDSPNEIKVEGIHGERDDGDEVELPENLAIISTTNTKRSQQPQPQVSFQGSFEDEPKDDFTDGTISDPPSAIITNTDELPSERTSTTSADDFTLQDSVKDSAVPDPSTPTVDTSGNSGDAKVFVRRLRRPLVKSRGNSRAVFASPMAAKNMMIMPYSFGFSVEDPTGGVYHRRTEEQPNEGPLVGSYSYLRADGVYMTVKYTAGTDGYKATVYESAPPAGTRTVLPSTTRWAAPVPGTSETGGNGTNATGGAEGVSGINATDGAEGVNGTRTAGAHGSPGHQQRPNNGVRSQSQIIRDAYREDIIQREKQQQEQQQLQLQQLLHQQKQQQFQQLQHQYRQQQQQLENQFRQHQQQQHQFPQGLLAENPAFGPIPETTDQLQQNFNVIGPITGALFPLEDANSQTNGQFPAGFLGVQSSDGTNSQDIGQFPTEFSGVASPDNISSQNFVKFPLNSPGLASPDGSSSHDIGQIPAGFSGVASPDGTSSQAIGQITTGFSGVAFPDSTSSQAIGQFPGGFSGVASPDGTSSQAIGQIPAGFSGIASLDGTSSLPIAQFTSGFSELHSPDGTNSPIFGQFPLSSSGVASPDSTSYQNFGQFPLNSPGVASSDGTSSQPIGQFGQFPAGFSGVGSPDGTISQPSGQFSPGFSVVVPAAGSIPQNTGQSALSFTGVTSPFSVTNRETISDSAPTLQEKLPTNQFAHGINDGQEHQRLPEFSPESAAAPGFVGQSPVYIIRQQATGVQPPPTSTTVQGSPRPSSGTTPFQITLTPGQNQFATDEFSPTITVIQGNHQGVDITDDQGSDKNENEISGSSTEAERQSNQNELTDNEQNSQLSGAINSDASTTINSPGQSGSPNVAQSPNIVQGAASGSLPDQYRVQFRPIPVRPVDRNRFPFPESIFPGNQFAPGSGIQHIDRPLLTAENVNDEGSNEQIPHPSYISFDANKGQEVVTQVIVPGVESTQNIPIDWSVPFSSIAEVSESDNTDTTNSEVSSVQQPFNQELDDHHIPNEQLFGLITPIPQTPEQQTFGLQSFGHQLPTQQLHVDATPEQQLFTNQSPDHQPLNQQAPDQQKFNEHSPGQETLFEGSPDKQAGGQVSIGQEAFENQAFNQNLHVQISSTQQQSESSSFAGYDIFGYQSVNSQLPGQQSITNQQSTDQSSDKQTPNQQLFGLETYSPEKQPSVDQQSIEDTFPVQVLSTQEPHDQDPKLQPSQTSQSPGQQSPNERFNGKHILQSSSRPSVGQQHSEVFTGIETHEQSPNKENNQHIFVQKPISENVDGISDQQHISPSFDSPQQSGDAIISPIGDVHSLPKPDGNTPQSSIRDESRFGVSGDSASANEYEVGVIERTKESSVQTTGVVGQPIRAATLNPQFSQNDHEISQAPILTDDVAQENTFDDNSERENVGNTDQQTSLNSADELQTDVVPQNTLQQVNIIPGVVATYGNIEDDRVSNPSVIRPHKDIPSRGIDSSNIAGAPLSGKPQLQPENIIVSWPSNDEQSISHLEDSQTFGNGNVILNTINRPNQQNPYGFPIDPYQGINDIPYFQNNVPAPIFPGFNSGVRGAVQSNQVSGIAPSHPLQITSPLHYVAQDSKVPANQTGEQLDSNIGQYNISQGLTRPFYFPQHLPFRGITNYHSTQHAVTQHTKNTHQLTFYPFPGEIFPGTSSESQPTSTVNDKRAEETKPCSCEKNGNGDLKDLPNLALPEHRFTFLQNAAAKLPFPDQVYFRNILNQIINQSNRIRQFEQGNVDTAPIVWRVPTRINLDGQSSLPKPSDGSDSQSNNETIKPVVYTLPKNELEVSESVRTNSASGNVQEIQDIVSSNQEKDQHKGIESTPNKSSAENDNIYSNIQTDVAPSDNPADSKISPSGTINNLNPVDDSVSPSLNKPTHDSDQTTIEIERNQSELPVSHPNKISHHDSTSEITLGKNPLDPTSSPFGVLVSQPQSQPLPSRPNEDTLNAERDEETQSSQLTQSSTTRDEFGGDAEHDSKEPPSPVSFTVPQTPERPRGYNYSPPAKPFDFAAQFRG